MQPTFRYHDYNLNQLVNQLDHSAIQLNHNQIKQLQQQRKSHISCVQISHTKIQFNNKTKQGTTFDTSLNLLPYKFIPKFKNQTFILPDRAHAKGNLAKRFKMKMKDTSVYSFTNHQHPSITKHLHIQQKLSIIKGRKMEQLNRILDRDSGTTRAAYFKNAPFRTRKFCPTSTTSELFSKTDPLLSPRDKQGSLSKKVSLTKTFDFTKWNPTSSSSDFFPNTKEPQLYRNTFNNQQSLR